MTDETPRAAKQAQTMKPATAAKKLGIFLSAAPDDFQSNPITRAAFDALQSDPPEWLVELRLNGPHPRDVVARKLGVSISGLARAEVTECADPPRKSRSCWRLRRSGWCANVRRRLRCAPKTLASTRAMPNGAHIRGPDSAATRR